RGGAHHPRRARAPIHRGLERGSGPRGVDCGGTRHAHVIEGERLSRTREIQVGITVLVALGITLWGVTWLKQFSLARQVRVWHVTFPQTGGLSTSDEVQVNGLRKGSVGSVALIGDHVAVDLALASDITLTRDCRVAVRNVGLMGEKVIAVDLHASGTPFGAGDTIPGIYEKGIPEVMAGVGGTIDAITELAAQLKS